MGKKESAAPHYGRGKKKVQTDRGGEEKGHGRGRIKKRRLLWMSARKTDGWQSDRSFRTSTDERPRGIGPNVINDRGGNLIGPCDLLQVVY